MKKNTVRINTTLTVCPTCGTNVGPCIAFGGKPLANDHPARLQDRNTRRRMIAKLLRDAK